MIDGNVTLVTAYYQIKSKFSVSRYESWIQNFMKIRSNKIIFTDSRSVQSIKKYDDGGAKNHYVILEMTEFLTSKYEPQWKRSLLKDHEKSYHTVPLYKIWAEKIEFLRKSVIMNPYNTDNFVWCDIGCFRNTSRIDEFREWPKSSNIKNKIIFLEIEQFLSKERLDVHKIDERFKHVVRVGGGIIAGNRSTIPKMHKLYYGLLQRFFETNTFAGKDQNVYAFMILQNPELTNLVSVPTNYRHDKWFYLEDYLNK